MNKRIETITLKGINTSMPDYTVPEGACEELRNLRLRDGAWQKVGNPQLVENIALPDSLYDPDTFSLLYIHEVEGANHYVCEGGVEVDTGGGVIYQMHLFVYADGAWADLGSYAEHNNSLLLEADIKVTSFGKVLIVTSNGVMQNFLWSDGAYHLFAMPRSVNVYENKSIYTNADIASADADYTDGDGNNWWFLVSEGGDIMRPTGDVVNNLWWGEICYLVAYRMKDGTILSPSPLRILCSEKSSSTSISSLIVRIVVVDERFYYAVRPDVSVPSLGQLQMFRPKLLITIPDGIDTNLIDRVAIYSTRINSIIDFEKIHKEYYYNTRTKYYHDFYADNKLPEQPLYLVEEKPIADISNNRWEVELGYDKLENLTTTPQMYEPVQLHTICAEAVYDFNHRMHYGGITTTLYSHSSALLPSTINVFQEYVTIENTGSVFSQLIATGSEISSGESETYIPAITAIGDAIMLTPIISYPDYRATSMRLIRWSSDEVCDTTIPLKPAIANNFAYYITPPSELLKYPQEGFAIDRATEIPAPTPTFSEPNRIQVSATNNPFSLPFENSYAVGNEGSRVLAMNTIADSLVDSTFYGNYPLYIFTTDGIFALRAGSGEILYAGTENINHDRLIDSTTIALNGSVVYPCEEGLKALSGRTAVRISADIDTNLGIWDDWSGLEMAVNWRFGELYCVKKDGRVFVWNVENGAWSTRDDITGNLRQGYIAEVGNTLAIYNINEEVMSDISFRFVTRPLKFGSSAFKKIESLIVRLGARENIQLTCEVYASNDCVDWRMVRSVDLLTDHSFGLRRLEQSARFYRFILEGNDIINHFTLSQIDFSIQDRYNSKLR